MISKADFEREFTQVRIESTEQEGLSVSAEEYMRSAGLRQAIGGKFKITYWYEVVYRDKKYGIYLTLARSEYFHNRTKTLSLAYKMAGSRCLRYLRKLEKENKL